MTIEQAQTLTDNAIRSYKAFRLTDAQQDLTAAVRYARNDKDTSLQFMCSLLIDLAVSHITMARFLEAKAVLSETSSLIEELKPLNSHSIFLEASFLGTQANLLSLQDKIPEAAAAIEQSIELMNSLKYADCVAALLGAKLSFVIGSELDHDNNTGADILRYEQALLLALESQKTILFYEDPLNDCWPRFGIQWTTNQNIVQMDNEVLARIAYLKAKSSPSLREAEQFCDQAFKSVPATPNRIAAKLWLLRTQLAHNKQEFQKSAEASIIALDLARNAYAYPDPQLVQYLINAAATAKMMQHQVDFEQHITQARQLLITVYGDRHPRLAKFELGLAAGRLHFEAAASEHMERLITDNLQLLENVFEDTHRDVIEAKRKRAKLLRTIGRREEAQSILQDILKTAYGKDGGGIVAYEVLNTLIELYEEMGLAELLVDCLSKQQELIEKGRWCHTDTSKAQRLFIIACKLRQLGQLDRAESVINRACQLSEHNNQLLQDIHIWLAKLYNDMGKLTLAKETLFSSNRSSNYIFPEIFISSRKEYG